MYKTLTIENIRQCIADGLRSKGIQEEIVLFVEKQLSQSSKSDDLWITPYNLDASLEKKQKGLSVLFHKVSEEIGIEWQHTSPEEDKDLRTV